MKKKVKQSGEAPVGGRSADYVVGQVCGSLFQEKSASSSSSSGSLSALFSVTAPAAPLLFQPPPQRKPEAQKESPQVKGRPAAGGEEKKKKKPTKNKSAADQKLENRESALQEADEDERGHQTSAADKKRKRKASELGRDHDTEHWVMKRQRRKAGREEEAQKRRRTVFVGNLPSSCTKKTLRSLFRDKGSIESIRFRSVVREDSSVSRKVAAIKRTVHPKRQSLNAYVVFKEEEGVDRALERNGMEIEKDFHIRVDRVTDGSSHDHKRSVFVGNLSFEINEHVFRDHFQECGKVEAVRLIRDKNSGLGKGFGYVLFESADSVQLALELDGSKLEGRSVRVKRSVKKETEKKKSNGKGPTGRTGRSPAKGGPGRERGAGPGGFKSQKKFTGSSGSFRGEMVDPNTKDKKKGLKKKKKKPKPSKSIHI
ncbi:RNA-binding protein 34 [Mugil cephalus]|uniref:RNA-binding protein 34 n=1 Tax=Mugil cephalus TaxID=48193 RepID=UPI001FB64EDF|nr:RNA-binding protein 34 [Mugil cephalus]